MMLVQLNVILIVQCSNLGCSRFFCRNFVLQRISFVRMNKESNKQTNRQTNMCQSIAQRNRGKTFTSLIKQLVAAQLPERMLKKFRPSLNTLPPGSNRRFTKRARSASLRVVWMGLMGWAGISKVSFNFLYTLWAYRPCICTLICNSQKLSPTFLQVSKFDVKLKSGGMLFKITIFR